MKPQNFEIFTHLQKGNKITSLEAYEKFKVKRLSAIIHELRKDGINIKKENLKTGTNKIVAQYSLEMKD